MERLVAASGHGIELAFGENVAGVGPGVQIPVRGGLGLEERHYCIRRTSGGCEIEDLRSVSGTWINGSLLSGIYLLKPGDLIQAGALALRYEVQETATSPAAETPVTMDGAGPSQEDVLEDDATAKKLQFGQTSEDAAVAKSPSMARSGLVIGATIGTVVLGVFATVAFFLWDSESPIARIQGVLAPAGDESGGTEKAAEERTDKEIFLSDLERWVPTRGMVYHYRDIPRTIATLEKITAWVPEALTKYGIGDVKELVPDKIGSAGIRHSLIFARTGGGSILGNFENNVEFMRIDRPLDDAAWENALEEFVARAAGMSLEMDWAEWEGRLYGEIPAFAALGVAPYAVRILDDKTVVAGPAAEVKALTPLNRTNPAFEAFRRGDEATIAYFDFKKFPDIGLMGIGVRSDFKEGCLAFDFTREVSIRIEAETAGPSSDLKLQAFRNALESVRSRVGGDRTPLGKSLAKFMTGVQLELEGGVARLQVKTSFEDVRVPVERMKELANREEDSSVERLAMHLASVGNAAIAAGSAELKEAHDLETAVFLVERGVRGGVGSEFERTEFRVPRMTDAQFMGISKFLQWEQGRGFVMKHGGASDRDSFAEEESALLTELMASVAPDFVHQLANERAGMRNAQNIASVCAAAKAAGTEAFEDVRDLEEAVRRISMGVYGAGEFSKTRFAVPNLDEESIFEAMKYLEWNRDIKVIVFIASAPKEEEFVVSAESEETKARRDAQSVASVYASAIAAGAIPSPPDASLRSVVNRVVLREAVEGSGELEGTGEFRGVRFVIPNLSDREVELLMDYLRWEDGILYYDRNPKRDYVGA